MIGKSARPLTDLDIARVLGMHARADPDQWLTSAADVSITGDRARSESATIRGPNLIIQPRLPEPAVHHSDKPGILVNGAKNTIVQNAMIDGASPNSGDNISCSNSPNLSVSNSRLSRGASGVMLRHCDGSMLSDLEGHDQTGAYPGGQFVAWQNSINGSHSNFSNVNTQPNRSGGDVINAWRSSRIRIASGFLDGNFCPDCVGIQFDEGTSNAIVSEFGMPDLGCRYDKNCR